MNATRTNHLSYCKKIALAKLGEGRPEQITEALKTFVSGLSNHPETKNHPAIAIGKILTIDSNKPTKKELEDYLSRFG